MNEVGLLEIELKEDVIRFGISVDMDNKLLYFIEKNGGDSPELCVSLDTLTKEPIKDIIFKPIKIE